VKPKTELLKKGAKFD
jgi:hypothetical protein